MSVLIKDMEMPSRRESCPFCSVVANDEPLCDLLVGELCLFGVACPLIPVPPHGRLIDADALYERAKLRSERFNGCFNDLDNVINALYIETFPTIIEAEGGE